ncbi:MAG: hypothetical protein ACJ786_13870 [Catenulispora sp.]
MNPQQKRFIETHMLWLADQFGRDVARREIAVPGSGFYPPDYSPGPAQIRSLVRRVAVRMDVDPDRIEVRFFRSRDERKTNLSNQGTTTVGRYSRSNGSELIEIDLDHADDPALLTGIVAHELSHARLLGENRISSSRPKGEELTDLAAVLLGMGVFVANASVRHKKGPQDIAVEPLGELTDVAMAIIGQGENSFRHIGYLKAPEFGYALACLCGLRREVDPPWAIHLHPPVRVMLRRSLAYFKQVAARVA